MVVGELEPEAFAAIERIARRARRAADSRRRRRRSVDARPTSRARSACARPSAITATSRSACAGAHQIGNALVAVRMLELLDAQGIARAGVGAIASALARPSWPGRLDLRRLAGRPRDAARRGPQPGRRGRARVLSAWAPELDACRSCSPACATRTSTACCARSSRPSARWSSPARRTAARPIRKRSLSSLAAIAPDRSVTIAASPAEALEIAWRLSPRIIVAGSIFLLGDVMKAARQLVIPFENGS